MRWALTPLLAAQLACTPGLKGQCQIIREPGPPLALPHGFAQVDGMLVQRAAHMASAVQDLRGPLARSFRIYFEDETLPLLCGRLEHARQLATAGQARSAGRIYQALILSSQVFELAIAVHAFSEYADRIGAPSGRIMAMQEVFVQQIGPLLAAALSEDPDGIAVALAKHGPEYAAWVGALDRWSSQVSGQTERLRVAKLVWDVGTLVAATYDAATAAADMAVAGRPPGPPLPLLVGSGAAAASFNGAASAELAEVLRGLIAIGALDAPVVAGLSQLGGGGPTATHMASLGAEAAASPQRAWAFPEGELERHFGKHAKEWGTEETSQEEYVRRARELLNSRPEGEILGATRANGDVLRYNMRTNEFAVGTAEGRIRTFFRPEEGIAYWFKQIQ